MFLVPTQHQFVDNQASLLSSGSPQLGGSRSEAAAISSLLSSISTSMERSATEYSQSDHASAAQYATQQEVRPSNYSTSATPTSEYSVYPPSARSGSFPEHIQRSYHPASNHNGSSGGMAQQASNPSIAAPSPTYAYGQHSPYGPPPGDMSHSYQHPYAQPRPDWTGYGQHSAGPLTPANHVFPPTPSSAPPQGRPNQVYSFVPIPGAQQHKRPRRRYEEIERMYKCGWNGCEKAYGTLNHLNAHVTMQSHGQKRTPEEFKEIRKEWKQRKKEEEAQRKAEEERQRQAAAAAAAAAQNGSADPQSGADGASSASAYGTSRQVQLPPIGYQPSQYPAPPSAGAVAQQPLPEYNGSHMYSANYQPQSPYGQPNQSMYSSHNGGQTTSH
ncbi:C2H2 finger domain transcription factor [Colletotrichum fructicola]|uniref:C2H2 finger domain transcription factor CON7 n=1 Tax=Colletotrichum fructicola (strain Nara gc5) TaxID=1213859 RepID=A0A7J6JMI9_COLFN|nr:C2H2 finger domain transcription factor [Colletotrichum fructicola]KAE9581738.1 C2H2 finger domain transcription factor [Colletotrichum fructicola]KAF4491610.1 C2H2 finger domain transcription factor CON7 [Colletotrichum fructicola Nara gc5]USO21575.1 C2H2 transcription factor [Colletotrichum gloeosporioides]